MGSRVFLGSLEVVLMHPGIASRRRQSILCLLASKVFRKQVALAVVLQVGRIALLPELIKVACFVVVRRAV